MALLKYPIFAAPGDTIDLRSILGSSINYAFKPDYQSPPYLILRDDRYIDIAANAVTEITPVFIELNNGDEFYLVIAPASAPVLRYAIDEVSMLSDSTYDLNPLVKNAKRITFQTGQAQPIGSSLSGGIFTIGTAAGTAYFTATNDTGSTHFSIKINVVQALSPENFKGRAKYRTEIAGIDVSNDLREIPFISEGLDYLTLNTYRVNDATVVLNNDKGKYNQEVPGNFWQTHSLNPGGYQERIHIFKELLVGGVRVSHLMFSGSISQSSDNLHEVSFSLVCVDISQNLRKTHISSFSQIEKWGVLESESAATDFFKTYEPEASILPILEDADPRAWRDAGTELTLHQQGLASEGLTPTDEAQILADGLQTRSLFSVPLLLKFNTPQKNQNLEGIVNAIALDAGGYQVEIDAGLIEFEDVYIANLGNTAFAVENTRITRRPVDWVYDATEKRILTLLSNDEPHIPDLLGEQGLERKTHKVLHTFEIDLKVHRIARRDSTNYYILTSDSDLNSVRIHHYATDTDTLTEHVSDTDTYPPTLLKTFYQGTVPVGITTSISEPDRYDNFKVVNNYLYYKYTTDTEMGVARVDTTGTTEMQVNVESNAPSGSFAYDVTETQAVYLAAPKAARGTNNRQVIRYEGNLWRNLNNLAGISAPVSLRVGSWAAAYTLHITGEFQGSPRTVNVNIPTGSSVNQSINTFFDSITSISSTPEFLGRVPGLESVPPSVIIRTRARTVWIDFIIKRRNTGGTVETLYDSADHDRQLSASSGPSRNPRSITECFVHNDYLYVIEQDYFGSFNSSAVVPPATRGALIRYDLSSTPLTPTAGVEIFSGTPPNAPCSLMIYQDAVHYMQHLPIISRIFGSPFAATEPSGALTRIESDGSTTSRGNLWYDNNRPYPLVVTRALPIGNDLHVMMGYAEDQINADIDPKSVLHLIRTNILQYIISDTTFSGSHYDALAEIARLINATLEFRSGIIYLRDRTPFKAETDASTGLGTADIQIRNTTRILPQSGYLRIGDEFIGYSGIHTAQDTLTGIQRGVRGTPIANHAEGAACVFFDYVFGENELIGNIVRQDQTTRLFNVIRNSDGSVEVRDTDSIEKYGERVYTLDVGRLTRHQYPWIEAILQAYLNRLKNLQQRVSFNFSESEYVQPGDYIGVLNPGGIADVFQVLSLNHASEHTEVKGLTV